MWCYVSLQFNMCLRHGLGLQIDGLCRLPPAEADGPIFGDSLCQLPPAEDECNLTSVGLKTTPNSTALIGVKSESKTAASVRPRAAHVAPGIMLIDICLG